MLCAIKTDFACILRTLLIILRFFPRTPAPGQPRGHKNNKTDKQPTKQIKQLQTTHKTQYFFFKKDSLAATSPHGAWQRAAPAPQREAPRGRY